MDELTESESKSVCLTTSNKTRRLVRGYNRKLGELGVQAIRRGTRLQHVKWMCLHVEGNIEDEIKANRWLGWIQAWLTAENIFSLEECMQHSRQGKVTDDAGT